MASAYFFTQSNDRFELESTSSQDFSVIYRIDRKTGEVWLILGTEMTKLVEKTNE